MESCGQLSCWEWGCECDLLTRQDKIEHIIFKASLDVRNGHTKIGDIKKYPNLIVFYRIELRESLEKMTDEEIDENYVAFE